jgi:hypothetical protein
MQKGATPHKVGGFRIWGVLLLAWVSYSTKSTASEPSGCSFLKIAELPITQLSDDIAIPVSVNGKDVLMVIGTGSPFTVLFKDRARKMGLERTLSMAPILGARLVTR